MANGFKLNIPSVNTKSFAPPRQSMIKNAAPKLSLPKQAMNKVSRPFMPRQRRFNPAPNPKQF